MPGHLLPRAGATRGGRRGASPIGALSMLLPPPRTSPLGNRRATGAALWAGYTQQSHSQVYNGKQSWPFRETNYPPEVMLAFHPDPRLLGFDVRLLN